MNKKLFVAGAAVLGIISIFMSWFSAYGYSINAVSEEFNDGYILSVLYIGVLGLSIMGNNKPYSLKLSIGVEALGVLAFLLTVLVYTSNTTLLTFGASLGVGFYLCLLASGFISVYNVVDMKSVLKYDQDQMNGPQY